LNKHIWAVSLGLMFLIITPIVHATKSECYNGLMTIVVEAPNEVRPEEEFYVNFTVYSSFYNVYIISARVELWAMGSYKQETLLEAFFLKERAVIKKNTTFVLEPATSYPNIVICDIWLLCREEESSEDQFSHFRFTLSWCTDLTYEELREVIRNQESDISKYQSTMRSFEMTTAILAATSAFFAATTVYFVKAKRKRNL